MRTLFMTLPRNIFLALFILSSVLAVYGLRDNNLTMVKLRDAVYEADRKNGDVNTALNKLREHVHSHMNTDLSSGNSIKPPIQLRYTYERLQARADAGNNQGLYTEAQNYCQKRFPSAVPSLEGSSRLACVQDYILSHGGKAAPKIPASLYQFDFASPVWSPDLAGWSLVLSAVFLLAFVARLVFDRRRPQPA